MIRLILIIDISENFLTFCLHNIIDILKNHSEYTDNIYTFVINLKKKNPNSCKNQHVNSDDKINFHFRLIDFKAT